MKTLDIVYVLDELADVCLDLPKRAVLLQIHLLSLECFEETLCFSVVVWIIFSRHAHQRTGTLQSPNVGTACVLHSKPLGLSDAQVQAVSVG